MNLTEPVDRAGQAVGADLQDRLRQDLESAPADLGVGEHQTGVHQRQLLAREAIEGAAVALHQFLGVDRDLRHIDRDVQPLVREVDPADVGGVQTGLPQALQEAHHRVEVVEAQVVLAGQDRPDQTDRVGAVRIGTLQDAQQAGALGVVGPGVDVGVEQRDLLGSHPADVADRDAEQVGDVLIDDVRGLVEAVDVGDTRLVEDGLVAAEGEIPLIEADAVGRDDQVEGPAPVVLEQVDQGRDVRVAQGLGGQRGQGGGGHEDFLSRSPDSPGALLNYNHTIGRTATCVGTRSSVSSDHAPET